MAGTSRMVIELIKTVKNEEKSTAQSSPVEGVKADTSSSIKSAKGNSTAKTMVVLKAVDEVLSQAKRMAVSTGNRYFNLSEDYMAENQMTLVNAYVGRAKSLASDLITGAQIGSTFGPIGTVVGLIAGGVMFGVDSAIQIRERQSSWYSQLNATNYQTEWSQARMGLIDGGRGTEN